MLPSIELRKQIEDKYEIDLEKYGWTVEFYNEVCSISLDSDFEEDIFTMREVFESGLNIGKCDLTSRYLARSFDDVELHFGICNILVGTPQCEKGFHKWLVMNDYVIDTTLMIMLPVEEMGKYGYVTDKVVAHDSARVLSEYDTYSNWQKVRYKDVFK